MELIDKAVVIAEIEELIKGLKRQNPDVFGNEFQCMAAAQIEALNLVKGSLNTLEVKELNEPGLDNGNMPVERWKEACKAASCQANYRKSHGYTETCDDYFVDGVQWADEHPKEMKDVDLNKELKEFLSSEEYDKARGDGNYLIAKHFFELGLKAQNGNYLIAKHFFELGLKAQKGE